MAVRKPYVDISFEEDSDSVITIQGQYQYDRGIELRISGLLGTEDIRIHYSYDGQPKVLSIIPEWKENQWVCSIPDSFLFQPKEIVCYIYIKGIIGQLSTGMTTKEIHLPLIPRPMPADVSQENGQLNFLTQDSLIDILRPIGSFYISKREEDPTDLFGGAWVKHTDIHFVKGDSSQQSIDLGTNIWERVS